VSEAFAQAHRFRPGSSFGAVINGRWKTLTVTGIALSPEFVLQSGPAPSARTSSATASSGWDEGPSAPPMIWRERFQRRGPDPFSGARPKT